MGDSVLEPVSERAEQRIGGPAQAIGLAVSGGGYRAMLFHLGAFLRLFEMDLLKGLSRISSVSGGSITAAKIGIEWNNLNTRQDFMDRIVRPIRRFASRTVDFPSIFLGLILPQGVANQVSRHYRNHLFGDATLQDLPDDPRFVINATHLAAGTYWQFSKRYMGDYMVGRIANPRVSLADAVAASSAFPPALSPFVLRLTPDEIGQFTPGLEAHMYGSILLSDGGVYDNFGLETLWNVCDTILVSDAGGGLPRNIRQKDDWVRLGLRSVDILYWHIAVFRKEQVIRAFSSQKRKGTYWGIRNNIDVYDLSDALPCPFDRTKLLAATPTRLARLDDLHQDQLINWGYAICDAAVRRHLVASAQAPLAFPYPNSLV